MMPKCPYCTFEAMNQKVVDMHVQEKHKEELEKEKARKEEERKGKEGEEEKEKKEKKGGRRVVKKPEDVKDHREWYRTLVKNYCYTLCHNKRCGVTLHNGQVLEGLVHAKDPFFILLDTDDGRRLTINKAYVVMIEPKE